MDTDSTDIKVMHFVTGSRNYAIPISFIKEIIRLVEILPVSELPPFVAGVINLRGQMVPVIDFLHRAGAGYTQKTIKTRIIILRIKRMLIGIIVDQVHEVIEVPASAISQNIQTDVVLNTKYIAGMFVHQNQWITLVDIERLLTDQEVRLLESEIHHA
jgi:purine-binding chemotaxis protein CheW